MSASTPYKLLNGVRMPCDTLASLDDKPGSYHYIIGCDGYVYELKGTQCNNCHIQQERGLKACDGCHNAIYCSRECQKQHWKSAHKSECDAPKTHRKAEMEAAGWVE